MTMEQDIYSFQSQIQRNMDQQERYSHALQFQYLRPTGILVTVTGHTTFSGRESCVSEITPIFTGSS